MTDVVIVADPVVGDRLIARLSALPTVTATLVSADELRAATNDAARSIDYVVLHDAPLRAAKPKRADPLYDVIRHARAVRPRLPIAVLLTAVRDDDLKKAVFVPSVDLGIDIGKDAERMDEAIDRLAVRITGLASRSEPPPAGSHEIGSLVDVDFTDNSEGDGPSNRPGTAYRMARWRSLMPVDGSAFARDVRDVVDALARYPLRVNLPWDPLGRPPRATSKAGPPERATLKDVHRVFASDDAIAKIYGKASAPLTRAAARALLDGERHPHEDAAEYERWWSVWSEGIRPPAVLLDGETGVGKTLMAEFLTFLLTPTRTDGAEQGLSSRARFVKMNGAGLRVADFSHQWMGVAPGIWSGIDDAVVGRLARAAHGVAFIDELGDMPQDVQAAVLTFLDSREIQPGGIEPFLGYQHIIAATNKELADEVASGAFRQDLLARFPLRLRIPPLRERPIEERERWVDFLAQDPVVNPRLDDGQYEVTHLDRGALDRLIEHDYTNGNFRELTERVHESLRRARRHLRRVVTSDDVPPPEQAIARSMTAGAER